MGAMYTEEWIRRRQAENVSLPVLLRRRELGMFPPGTSFLRGAYQCYLNITPNSTLHNIDRHGLILKRFSPCGRYLICFSSLSNSVSVRKYTTYNNMHYNPDPFLAVFPEHFTTSLVSGEDESAQMVRECIFITPDSKHIVVAVERAVADAAVALRDVYRNNESLMRLGAQLLCNTTFICISMQDGSICDKYEMNVDRVWISHGVHLVGRLLGILSLQHQTIHLLHIDERSGKFVVLNRIGRYLYDDDNLVTMGLRDDDMGLFTGLKQRLMTAFYNRCIRTESTDEFMHVFGQLKSLRIWQMQLVSSDIILIRYVPEDTFALGESASNATALFVFYNWRTADILSVFERSSPFFGNIVSQCLEELKHPDILDNRFPCTPQYCRQGEMLHQRIKFFLRHLNRENGSETNSRLVSQLPFATTLVPTQTPYLDPTLFNFDDRLVATVERMRIPDREIIKFHSRVTSKPVFTLDVSRGRCVQLLFHPYEPFAISSDRSHASRKASFHYPELPEALLD